MFKRLPTVKRPATTVSGALRQCIRYLEREGSWIQGSWFRQQGQEIIDPEAPLCDKGWGACSDGILQGVIFGLPAVVEFGCVTLDRGGNRSGSVEEEERYWNARTVLDSVTPDGDIIAYNDDGGRTRTEVLGMFQKAYRRAQWQERKGSLPKAKDLVAA